MNISRWILVAAAVAAFATPVHAADVDVTGKWTMAVETQAGSGSPIFELKQEGASVTGTYTGQLGTAPVTGTVSGDDVVLNYVVSGQGMELKVTYSGKVEGDTISGKVAMGELGDGTFTGKKE